MEETPIFGRIVDAMAKAEVRMREKPKGICLGRVEWKELCELCLKWGVDDWPPRVLDAYNADAKRARFRGVPIYQVDAETLIEFLF